MYWLASASSPMSCLRPLGHRWRGAIGMGGTAARVASGRLLPICLTAGLAPHIALPA
jgi:hypothetical protein